MISSEGPSSSFMREDESFFGIRLSHRFWSLLLILLCLVTLYKVRDCEFLDMDDDAYIWLNPAVKSGLTLSSFWFAATADLTFDSPHADYWQPVTMLSHIMVSQIFGLDASIHHLVNLAIHIVNAILVFYIAAALMRSNMQAFFVAALFALHPLKVQSVAWAVERKDVLSGMFFLLSVCSYLRYGSNPTRRNWYLVVLFFLLGMLSKPILMTLPCALLLMDFYPLNRAKLEWSEWKKWRGLILEKGVFLVISIATFLGPFRSFKMDVAKMEMGINWFGVVTHKYALQFYKMIWPRVSIFYAPERLPLTGDPGVFCAGILLAVLLAFAIYQRQRAPVYFVGLLWFLGLLIPVEMTRLHPEDRHMYTASVGFFIAAVSFSSFACGVIKQRFKIYGLSGVGIAAGVVVLSVYASVAASQIKNWKNSKSLYMHTLDENPANWHFLNNLGVVYLKEEKYSSALNCFFQAVRLCPLDEPRRFPEYNLIQAIHYRTNSADTVARFIETSDLKLKLDDHLKLMLLQHLELLRQLDLPDRGVLEARLAARLYPDNVNARIELALALFRLSRFNESKSIFRDLLIHHSELKDVRNKLAWILTTADKITPKEAEEGCKIASALCLETNYENSVAMDTLAVAQAAAGRFDNALAVSQTALDLATKQGDTDIAEMIGRHRTLFSEGKRVYSPSGQQLPGRYGFKIAIEPYRGLAPLS